MSWIPEFKIGLWNGWMLMVGFLLLMLIPQLAAAFGRRELLVRLGSAPAGRSEQRLGSLSMLLLLVMVILSVLLPLRVGTAWLFVGLAFWLAGAVMLLSALATAARTSPGEVFTCGLYRVSRHPLYLSMGIMLLGVCLACLSVIFLLLLDVYTWLLMEQAQREEAACLQFFGEPYARYLAVTPRWLGFPR